MYKYLLKLAVTETCASFNHSNQLHNRCIKHTRIYVYIYIILTKRCTPDITNFMFILNYILLYVLIKLCFQFPEDEDKAETCSS
jgi:hypothetical protein